MADLKERLVDYTQDAHAMEKNSLQMLRSMAKTTNDPQLKQVIEHHIEETEQHEARLRERLEAMGKGTSTIRDTGALVSAAFKGIVDSVRNEKPSKNARDGYVTEHVEIASYELLQRLAERAGDMETASVARQILEDERAMANKLESNWDKVVDLTLEEEGLASQRV